MTEPATVVASNAPHIRTPDQRVRVFVSSTLQELAAERAAARSAITRLHLTPTMFETGARSYPPRELYRAYLAQSEVFVGIYWQQYGWVAPGETVSGLEDEYLLSGDKPKLIYVKVAATREPGLENLLRRVRDDDRASYKRFNAADDLAELLADDLAILLTERFTQSGEAPVQVLRRPTLPASPTGIIGRMAEVAAVGLLLRDPSVHLVTLVGSGGIGKTRLALEAARNWAAAGADDAAWFVDLATVSDPALWTQALADALGVRPEGSGPVLDLITDRLQGREALIVLDNFEHLLPAAPELGRFLAACPDLTVLATSRSPLRLAGEREVLLAPLEMPPITDATDVEVIGRSGAVQLFVVRAAAARPGFVLTPANSAAVAGLCRLLDGIPLALELAAAQLQVLTPVALLDRLATRLDRPLDMATGPVDLPDRQRTLRATVEWSYGLLAEAEQAMLARLSVFVGAWTMPAAEAVGTINGDLDAVVTLTSLLRQSLAYADLSDPDEPRFRMLDTIRAYARERLAERGEVDATNARLARYLIGVIETVGQALQGPEHRAVAGRLDRERDGIRSAINWALQSDDAETATRLIQPLFSYWWSRGLLSMTYELAERASALPSASRLAPYASALLLGARGLAMFVVGRAIEAEPLLRRMLETATALGDARLRAYALLGLGRSLTGRAASEARERLDGAAVIFRGLQDGWGLAMAAGTSGQLALAHGDHAAAATLLDEALAATKAIDNDHVRAVVTDMLGLQALAAGDLIRARDHYAAAAGLHARLLDYAGSSYGMFGLASLALAQDKPEVAGRLIGAASRARRIIGVSVWPGLQSTDAALKAKVAAALGPVPFATATAEGAHMHIPDALEYGLASTAPKAVQQVLPLPAPAFAGRTASAGRTTRFATVTWSSEHPMNSSNDELTHGAPELTDMRGALFERVARMGPADADTVLFRTRMAAGKAVPLHSHIDPECFYVLSGGIEVFVLDDAPRWQAVETGRSLLIADGARHAVRNMSDQAADLIVATNNRLARFFREAGRPAAPGADLRPPTPDDIQRMIRVSNDYGYWVASPAESAAVTG